MRNSMSWKMLFVFMIGLAMMFSGCAKFGLVANNTDVCANVTPENPSYFCELADKFDVDISSIGTFISVANAVAISKQKYKAEEALRVLKDIATTLENPVSYLYVQKKVREIAAASPELFILVNEYVNQLSSQIMYPYDQQILLGWINQKISDMEMLMKVQEK